MTKTNEEFLDALVQFITAAQAMIITCHKARGYTFAHATLSTMPGKRYIRVVSTSLGSRSVYCFVDKTNGDILKAAGWKGPAKHARGNIFSDDPLAAVSEYGGRYLRG